MNAGSDLKMQPRLQEPLNVRSNEMLHDQDVNNYQSYQTAPLTMIDLTQNVNPNQMIAGSGGI